MLINGSSGVLEYSSWLKWQSWSPSAVGLGWWMACLPGLISLCCLGQVSFEGKEGRPYHWGSLLFLPVEMGPFLGVVIAQGILVGQEAGWDGWSRMAAAKLRLWQGVGGRQVALSLQKDGKVSRSGFLPEVTLRNSVCQCLLISQGPFEQPQELRGDFSGCRKGRESPFIPPGWDEKQLVENSHPGWGLEKIPL